MDAKLVFTFIILLMGMSHSLAIQCISDSGCPENQFCEGRSATKRCEECFDCAKVQRTPKRSSDGSNTCARHHHECGECNHGYQDHGTACLPVMTTPTPSFRLSGDMKMGPYHREQDDSKLDKAGTGMGVWGYVGLGIGALAFVSVCGGVVYLNRRCNNAPFFSKGGRKRRPRRLNKTEEESRLTSSSFNGSYPELARPTAPPPECSQNPPPTNPEFLPLHHEVVNSVGQRANPFIWDERGRCYVRRDQEAPVVDDQIQPQMNVPPQHNVNENAGGNTVATLRPGDVVDGAASGVLTNNIPTGVVAQSRIISGNHTPVPPGQRSSSNNDFPPQQHYDDVMGYFSFTAYAYIGRPQMASTTPHNSAQAYNGARPAMSTYAHHGPRTVASAPASPRRIDDTHLDLTNLEGNFEASNISLDSGTGTNEEHDRSVPSRSVSGSDVRELSDVENDIMYDNESPQMSPAQQPEYAAIHVHEVPDLDPEQMDIDLGEAEE